MPKKNCIKLIHVFEVYNLIFYLKKWVLTLSLSNLLNQVNLNRKKNIPLSAPNPLLPPFNVQSWTTKTIYQGLVGRCGWYIIKREILMSKKYVLKGLKFWINKAQFGRNFWEIRPSWVEISDLIYVQMCWNILELKYEIELNIEF